MLIDIVYNVLLQSIFIALAVVVEIDRSYIVWWSPQSVSYVGMVYYDVVTKQYYLCVGINNRWRQLRSDEVVSLTNGTLYLEIQRS